MTIETRNARRAAAVESILAAAADESITFYNVEFTEWKDLAGRAFEEDADEWRRQYVHGRDLSNSDREVYRAVPLSGLHGFPSKKLQKAIETADNLAVSDLRTPLVTAIEDLITKWAPVAAAIKAIKPRAIKGRKPSANPRQTPERTIENTGTCSVCGRNVKLSKDGFIVAHGYTVQYGFHQGGCFGVGYNPIEVGPQGAFAYLDRLIAHRDLQVQHLQDADWLAAHVEKVNEGKPEFKHTTVERVRFNIEHMIKMLDADIATFTDRAYNWVAKPLPGTTEAA